MPRVMLLFCLLALAVANCSRVREGPVAQQASAGQAAARKELEKSGVPCNRDALGERAKGGDARTVKLLVTAGIDPNTRYLANTTALMQAALFEHPDTVKALFEAGADVNAKDDYGRTALSFAIQNGAQLETVRILLDSGADPNAELTNGQFPITFASDSPEIVQALVDKGADTNVRDADTGRSILTLMVLAENPASVKILLEHKAKVNDKDNQGRTPLMFAAINNELVIAKLLLRSGASVDAKANDGTTALTMARRGGFSKMIRVLKRARASEESM
jgi:ankyrin repeat protein